MDRCAHCKGEVPKRFRRNARQGKAKRGAKTFYHYACAGWRAKQGQRVIDTWYGKGTVVKITQRGIHIKLDIQDRAWKYDKQHFIAFVRLEK